METSTLQAFLRVLYTVNSNPQYILAKSSSQVPAITCSETTALSSKSEPAYARTPLKACLAVICDSSPELLQDSARDFSLYVLDPLEAQPLPTNLAHAPYNASSPRGVAVALGLMSWALESNDSTSVVVTGTIIPNASPALEVVFALRETKRMPKPLLHQYPLISAPGLPQPHPPQIAGMSWLSSFHSQRDQQEQQTLTRSADFPELYIGPPRRARGRPEGSTSSKPKIASQGNTTSVPAENHSEPRQEVERRSKPKTKTRPPRAPPTYSPFICAPLTRHTTVRGPEGGATGVPAFYQHSYPFSQNHTQSHVQLHPQPYFHPTHNALLGLLSTIPSTSSGDTATSTTLEQQATLLSALQGLLSTNPHLLQLAATNSGLSANSEEQDSKKNLTIRGENNTDDEHDDGDSDIVILDSSVVDTTAFRRPSNQQIAASNHEPSPIIINQEHPKPRNQGIDSSPLPASTPPSGQENAPESSQTSTPSVVLDSTPTATPGSKTQTSKGRREGEDATGAHALDMQAPFTPFRTRKRKLGEYAQGQAYPPEPMSPPSPSPSMTHMSNSGRALTTRQRVQSSPVGGTKSVLLPSARLPSMLGSMRTITTSGSRPQVNSLGSSTHGHPASLTSNKSGNQSTPLISGSRKSRADHPKVASSYNIASDTTSLKRRRTLNEFMAEHEARKSTKVRKRSSSGRKLGADVSASTSNVPPQLSVKLLSTSRNALSSPPRALFRSNSAAPSPPASTSQSALVPDAAVSHPFSPVTTLACMTPSTSTSTAVLTKNPLKNFVLPAWARTSTAMLPRLSEEALARQRTEQEAKKVQVSLRRREAAKAKRRRLHDAEHPSRDSSDEDDQVVIDDVNLRTLHPSVARGAPLPPPPLPSLPVFASDAVEPIPSSPPRSHRQFVPPVVPSTPPRKPVSSGSALHRTPSKSGSCSLFTPSGQGPGSLFTPSTPSVARPLTRGTFAPRSPTVLYGSGGRKSPRKNMPQTPKRNSSDNHTPRSLRAGRSAKFVSPSLVIRTPQAKSGMGKRAFLLPPPSPCALRTPQAQKRTHSRAQGGSIPITPEDSGTTKQKSPSDKHGFERDRVREEDVLCREPDDGLPSHSTVVEGTSEPCDVTTSGNASQAEEEYPSSPLPPSSPPPNSPFSSPAKRPESDFDTPTVSNLVSDSDVLLPRARDSDGPLGGKTADTNWLSDSACAAASWFTDPEASAWLTETETWLTETEGGPPLLTDSDGGAWLSDSDAVFGDMSSIPPSSASNWLSDDADVDTDGEFGAMQDQGQGQGQGQGQDVGFDVVAFERVFAALVERGGQNVGKDEGGRDSARGVEFEFWESMPPLLGGENASNEAGAALGQMGDRGVDEDEAAHEIRELLDGLAGA